ncbi:hypothetical protein HDU86_004882 [Geranomyces michiganensis]|nr:hypothetical protein HDU86_004882 [Geranomyces michiganensis]
MPNTDFRFFPETPTRLVRPPGCAAVNSSRKQPSLLNPTQRGFPRFSAPDRRAATDWSSSSSSFQPPLQLSNSSASTYLRSLDGVKNDGDGDDDAPRAANSSSSVRTPGGVLGAAASARDGDDNGDHQRSSLFAPAIESPPRERKFAFPSTPAEEDEDIYGFGDFGQVFVTEEDLDRARQKLSEEEVITPEQNIAQMLNTLQQWTVECDVNDEQQDSSAFSDVALCFNFIELGRGALLVDSEHDHVVWRGDVLALNESVSTPLETESPPTAGTALIRRESRTLRWPSSQMTDVRAKDVTDEKPVVAFTVSEEHFLQFAFSDGQMAVARSCADAIRSAQKVCAERMLATPSTSLQLSPRSNPPSAAETPAPRKLWRAAVGIIPTPSPQQHSPAPATRAPSSSPPTHPSSDPELCRLHEDFEQRRAAAGIKRDQAVRTAQEEYNATIAELDRDYTRRRTNVLAERKAAAEAPATVPPSECQLCFDELETRGKELARRDD